MSANVNLLNKGNSYLHLCSQKANIDFLLFLLIL